LNNKVNIKKKKLKFSVYSNSKLNLTRTKKLKTSVVSLIEEKDPSRFHKSIDYYNSLAMDIKNIKTIKRENAQLKTEKKIEITEKIREYRNKAITEPEKIFKVLKGIYNKNVNCATTAQAPPKHKDLLNIVAHPSMLILAYKKIKGNKGATTKGASPPPEWWNGFKDEDKKDLKKLLGLPTGMSLQQIYIISELIKKGKYKWGYSKRVYVEKPGHKPGDKLRPITIPLFMDRMVQESIRMVLEAIYEPWMDKFNCSFGFRANYSCHDAITYISDKYKTQGFHTAIEGDIVGAYDNVQPEILLNILKKRISDSKLLEFIRQRLKMRLFYSKERKFESTFLGIPQGGIDSPSLFNIYLMELDSFIKEYLKNFEQNMNQNREKGYSDTNKRNSLYVNYNAAKKQHIKYVKRKNTKIGLLIKTLKLYNKVNQINRIPLIEKEIEHEILWKKHHIKRAKFFSYKMKNLPSKDQANKTIKTIYCRYADDWIIMGNFNLESANQIKLAIAKWLKDNLGLELSEKKTLVTNMRKSPAHFLGFEIFANVEKQFKKTPYLINQKDSKGQYRLLTKQVLKRVTSERLLVYPDRQRLISRLNMKGYCSKTGFPKSLPWLTPIEDFAIIKKYNGVIQGLANYYAEFISNPSDIGRWIYIIRWSCFHTLAHKFKISLKKLSKRYKIYKENTIAIPVVIKKKKEEKVRLFTLLSYTQAKQNALNLKRKETIEYRLRSPTQHKYFDPTLTGIPSVKSTDFLEKINWINWRTKASMDIACSMCGNENNLEMHHLRHIKKEAYVDIPKDQVWKRILSLRNRKQICLCRKCHNLIHTGKYNGPALKTLYDNRLVNMENFLKKGG